MLNTSQKVFLAKAASRFIATLRCACGLSTDVVAIRGGIKWALNLREGIDLAIYLLGGFEVRTLRSYRRLIREGDIVLDIGANIGAHTLPLAQLVGKSGKVIAFEPTEYAFLKLSKNLSLNPHLGSRVVARQMLLVSGNLESTPEAVYSSWPLDGSEDVHAAHRGRLMPTRGVTPSTLDEYMKDNGLCRIDFIKLDVDGNEYDVLAGGQETLRRFRPVLMMELAPHVYAEHPEHFDKVLSLLWEAGYQISDVGTGRHLPRDPAKVRHLIPLRGSINALATVGS